MLYPSTSLSPLRMDPRVFLIALLSCVCVNAQWDCSTHLGSRGHCVVLHECSVLQSLLTGPRRDKNAYEILKQYNCGYENNDPRVCCPIELEGITGNEKDCKTPDGDAGTCTSLEGCGYMKDTMLNTGFVSAENMDYIKRSKCTQKGVSGGLSVCCKSGADDRSGTSTGYQGQATCKLTAIPPDPNSKCCGVESSSEVRIVGGNVTAIDQFPWLVLLDYSREGYSCGGSLISGKYVLTAAHCLIAPNGKPRDLVSVRVGEYNTTNPGADCAEVSGGGIDCTKGAITIMIERFLAHEGYDPKHTLKHHDIGLIELKDTVTYTDFIRPICLPKSDFTESLASSTELFISGWGIFDDSRTASEVKLYAKVPYVSKEVCRGRYQQLARQTLADSQLCVGGEENVDVCSGDSGGPLMSLDRFTFEVAGVISIGTKQCGVKNWPSIYTKVYDYLGWIRRNIRL